VPVEVGEMSDEQKAKRSQEYLQSAGMQGSGRVEGRTPATSAAAWARTEKRMADGPDLGEFLGNPRLADPDFYHKAVASSIMCGNPLTRKDLQVIVAVLLGETDWQTLGRLSRGFEERFPLPENLQGYEPRVGGGRPKGDSHRLRDTKIARDFEELRKGVSADEAYAILAEDSYHRYATSLSIERVRTCVSKGRKHLADDRAFMEKLLGEITELKDPKDAFIKE